MKKLLSLLWWDDNLLLVVVQIEPICKLTARLNTIIENGKSRVELCWASWGVVVVATKNIAQIRCAHKTTEMLNMEFGIKKLSPDFLLTWLTLADLFGVQY